MGTLKLVRQPKSLLGKKVGGGKQASPGILVHLDSLAVGEFIQLCVTADTGLASAGSPIRCLVPDVPAAIFVGEAQVIEPGKVRLRFHNGGMHRSAPLSVMVTLLPVDKPRASHMPEVSFDALPEIK